MFEISLKSVSRLKLLLLLLYWTDNGKSCTHLKGNTGMYGSQDVLFTPLWQFIRPPVALCSSYEDPSLLNFLIFNQKNWQFKKKKKNHHSINPFLARISALWLKISLKLQLSPYFCYKISYLDPVPPKSKSNAPLFAYGDMHMAMGFKLYHLINTMNSVID